MGIIAQSVKPIDAFAIRSTKYHSMQTCLHGYGCQKHAMPHPQIGRPDTIDAIRARRPILRHDISLAERAAC